MSRPPPVPLRALVYDFDGTLIDSAEASFRCFARVFSAFEIPFDRARFEATYSPDWYRSYRALGLPQQRWDEADRLWVECYAHAESAPIGGALDALERARGAGLAQALVTSGTRERVERELRRHGFDGLLSPVLCSEDVVRKKPHPEGLLAALGGLAIEPRAAAYVGDSPEDVEMARAAGVYAVAIPGGFPNRDALGSSDYDLWAESLGEAADRLLPAAR